MYSFVQPEWKLVDPVCTFFFSILVLISTLNILKDTLRVLMEGTKEHTAFVSCYVGTILRCISYKMLTIKSHCCSVNLPLSYAFTRAI